MQSWPKLKETQGKKMQTHPYRLVPLTKVHFLKKYYNTYSSSPITQAMFWLNLVSRYLVLKTWTNKHEYDLCV